MTSRVVLIILGVTLLLVGGRTMLAAQSALGVDSDDARRAVNRRQDTLVREAARGDSLIRSIGPLRRSPFAVPPARIAAATVPRNKPATTPAPAPVAPPRVILLMQDGNSTLVQMEVDGETSPRMAIGNSFRGWTIVGVNERGIIVTNGSSTYNLPRP
jgi:hypothetical protein